MASNRALNGSELLRTVVLTPRWFIARKTGAG